MTHILLPFSPERACKILNSEITALVLNYQKMKRRKANDLERHT